MSHIERDPRQNPLRDYLRTIYFEPKNGADYVGKAPTEYAKALLDINGHGQNEGYFIALRGILEEALFVPTLQYLSPEGFTIEMSSRRQDDDGCDVVVRNQQGEAIGGIDLTCSTTYLYKKQRRSRTVSLALGFPVVVLSIDDIGARNLIHVLKNGEMPNINDFVSTRMSEGRNKRGFRSLLKVLPTVIEELTPDSDFREYLMQVQQAITEYIAA